MITTDFKVRLILVTDDKILLLKQTAENGGKYSLPGGTVENMEFATKALKRECKEELGIKIYKKELKIIHVLHKKRAKGDRVVLYFQADNWENEIQCRELNKFENVAWISMEDMPETVSPTVKHVIEQIKLGNRYSHLFLNDKFGFKKWKKKQKKKRRKLKIKLQTRDTDLTISPSSSIPPNNELPVISVKG